MEDLTLNPREHVVLKRFQKRLEKRHNVRILMPKGLSPTDADIIFVTIDGETQNRERVKKFLADKVRMSAEKVKYKENVPLITLSDSEEESTSSVAVSEETLVGKDLSCSGSSTNSVDELIIRNLSESSVCDIKNCSSRRRSVENDAASSSKMETLNPFDNSVCIIESPEILDGFARLSSRRRSVENDAASSSKLETLNPFDNSVCIIESPEILDGSARLWSITNGSKSHGNITRKNKKVRPKGALPSSQTSEEASLCEVSSTTDEMRQKKKRNFEEAGPATKEPAEFIPLSKRVKACLKNIETNKGSHDNMAQEECGNDDIIIIDEPSTTVRTLRPIVIDGSNVAREHGRPTNVFSSKGIKLAVDYFLARGHTQVTAFVPKFRRHCNRRNFPTTDPEILEELAAKQQVVFTPSRRVDGKCITSYDDRFVVQLACTNGGVVVTNDNYRDLREESDSFKEVIDKRLIQFLFVGDIFMIPDDPYGRNGPSLSEFLCFPHTVETSSVNQSHL